MTNDERDTFLAGFDEYERQLDALAAGLDCHKVGAGWYKLSSPAEGLFANLRAEGYWRLRDLFSTGQINIPRDNQLMGELAAMRYSYDSRGRIQIESMDSMRQRGLPSPDKADALSRKVDAQEFRCGPHPGVFPHHPVEGGNLPGQADHQGESMVGDGIRSVIGTVGHHHAFCRRRLDIDGVGADAVFDDAFQPRRRVYDLGGNVGVTG